MKTKEEILEQFQMMYDKSAHECYEREDVKAAMDEYAKQQAIAFQKWYILKMSALVEYITKIKPLVKSEELEQKLMEFEGKTFDDLYSQFIEQQSPNK